jgi:hypothetical protein
MALRGITELGVAEAWVLLRDQFCRDDLPPLSAVENEDWGRDYVMSRFLEYSPGELERVGLTLEPDLVEESSGFYGVAY